MNRFRLLFSLVLLLSTITVAGRPALSEPRFSVNYRLDLGRPGLLANSAMELCSPLVSPDGILLVVGTRTGRLVTVVRTSGKIRWERKFEGAILNLQSVEGNDLLVGTEDGVVMRLNLATGENRWEKPALLKGAIRVAPRIWKNLIAFVLDDRGVLSAISMTTGVVLASFDEQSFSERGLTPITMFGQATPLVTDNALYSGFDTGMLVRFDLNAAGFEKFVPVWKEAFCGDGQLNALYEEHPESRLCSERRMFRDVDSSPVMTEHGLLSGCHCRGLFMVDPATGSLLWELPVVGPGSAAIAGDAAFVVSSDGTLRRVNLADGSVAWQSTLDIETVSQPVLVGGTSLEGGDMLALATGKDLLLLNASDGKLLASFPTMLGVSAPPANRDGSLHFISNEGFLYQLDCFR